MQDLEHQLYDAKLDIINHQNAAAEKEEAERAREAEESGDEGEGEIPSTSELRETESEAVEMDEAQKAHFNDLKSANERVDQLEVEVSRT